MKSMHVSSWCGEGVAMVDEISARRHLVKTDAGLIILKKV